jgi:hypothetical protein
MMNSYILEILGQMEEVEVRLVRLQYAKNVAEMGRFSPGKLMTRTDRADREEGARDRQLGAGQDQRRGRRSHALGGAVKAVSLALGLASAALGCGPKIGPNGVTTDDAIIKVNSNVRDAQVYVDGRFIAPLPALRGGIAVVPGTHRLELRHDDYFSSYLELTVARAERKSVAIEMAPILP